MKRIFLLLTIAISCLGIKAQSTTGQLTQAAKPVTSVDGAKEVEELMRRFYSSLDNVMNAKDGNIEPVTKMLDKDFSSVRYILDVDGRQSRSTLTLDSYRNQMHQLSMTPGFQTRHEILAVSFCKAVEKFAIINYTLQITGKLNGEDVLRFRSVVTNYLHRGADGQWLIFESSGVNVYQEQEVGACPVAFTKASRDESQYTASILSPAGNSFKEEKLDFVFKPAGPKTLITCDKNAYLLENDQVTCVQENGSTVSLKLGKATGRVESLNVILAQHLYKGKCLSFKTMEQK
jgi:hypothetical protein